jgi:prepilin-type N-terminal cleavage/methylation domain-containing protein/prepilin-type processing-associated H-X9-DG protein
MRPSRSLRAFTLVELLVAIGIIALLIAILMPAVARVRKRSRSVACKAQLQQIGDAFQMYLGQNRNKYPLAPTLPSVNPENYPTLVECLARYVNNAKDVFHCPADESVFPTEGTSYFYYIELGQRPVHETFFWTIFQNPSQVPMLWDASTNFHGSAPDMNWLFLDGHVEDRFIPPVPKT